MPSDHVIKDVPAFAAAIRQAESPARDGWLVTFGIAPDKPATGYGYIRLGDPIADAVHKVARIGENPDETRDAATIARCTERHGGNTGVRTSSWWWSGEP